MDAPGNRVGTVTGGKATVVGAALFAAFGHVVPYALNDLPTRAGWVLEELTFQDFGFSEGSLSEALHKDGVEASAPTSGQRRVLRDRAIRRAKAWWV